MKQNINVFEKKTVLSQLPIIFLFLFENIPLMVSIKTGRLCYNDLNVIQQINEKFGPSLKLVTVC